MLDAAYGMWAAGCRVRDVTGIWELGCRIGATGNGICDVGCYPAAGSRGCVTVMWCSLAVYAAVLGRSGMQ